MKTNWGITLLTLIVIVIFGPIVWIAVSPAFAIITLGIWFVLMHLDYSDMPDV